MQRMQTLYMVLPDVLADFKLFKPLDYPGAQQYAEKKSGQGRTAGTNRVIREYVDQAQLPIKHICQQVDHKPWFLHS